MRYKAGVYELINTRMNPILKYYDGRGKPQNKSYRSRGWHIYGYRCSCSQIVQEARSVKFHEQHCPQHSYDKSVKLVLDLLAEKKYNTQQQHK